MYFLQWRQYPKVSLLRRAHMLCSISCIQLGCSVNLSFGAHSCLHTPPYITSNYCLQAATRTNHTAACTLPGSHLYTTMQLLAHYHATPCTLLYSHLHTTMQPHLHTTMQPLAYYQPAAFTLPCSRFHSTIQLLAHYHTAACTL